MISLCGGEADLLAWLAEWPAPRRVVAVTHPLALPVDLEGAFPEATVRRGELGLDVPDGWADLLWMQFALSPRRIDAARTLAQAGHCLARGGLVAVVDLAAGPAIDVRADLRDDGGLDPERDTLGLLRKSFRPLSSVETRHPLGWWRAYAFLGVNEPRPDPAHPPWLRLVHRG